MFRRCGLCRDEVVSSVLTVITAYNLEKLLTALPKARAFISAEFVYRYPRELRDFVIKIVNYSLIFKLSLSISQDFFSRIIPV